MHRLSLAEAVAEILTTTKRRKKKHGFPFFLLVGAGISHPPIPLASGVIEKCLEREPKMTLPPDPMNRYATALQKAFPQPKERQEFFQELIEGEPISAANLRLAHLLGERDADGYPFLTNLVFTPNFDEMLSRGLRLFGHEVIVCDHPKTTKRIDPGEKASKTLQVVHVHGTHWFYDCCNLAGEIERQAARDDVDGLSMGQLLDHALVNRSPIVVGYTGWEGDVLMSALKRRLTHGLVMNAYWFCYREEDANNLPEWLREHEHVRVITPAARAASKDLGRLPNLAVGVDERIDTLSPRIVLEEFISKLGEQGLQAPLLTREPLQFFAKQLTATLNPEHEKDGIDLYGLAAVIQRVKDAAAAAPEPTKEVALLWAIQEAVARADYDGALAVVEKLSAAHLTLKSLREIDSLLEEIYSQRGKEAPELGLRACSERLRLGSEIGALEGRQGVDWQFRAAGALNGRGNCFWRLDQNEKALDDFDKIVLHFKDTSEEVLQGRVAMALNNRGVVHGKLGREDEELDDYGLLLQQFQFSPSAAVRESVVLALNNRGITYRQRERFDDAISDYTAILEKFSEDPSPVIREQVALAFINRAFAFAKLGRNDQAIDDYGELLERFANDSSPTIREKLAIALRSRGVTYGQIEQNDREIADYDDLFERFSDDSSPAIREQLAAALRNRGVTYGQLGRNDDAIADYSALLDRFSDDSSPALREQVTVALLNRGVTYGQLGRNDDAIADYSALLDRFSDDSSPSIREQVASALRNRGVAYGQLGRYDDAIADYSALLDRFSDDSSPVIREQVAAALNNRAWTFSDCDRKVEARADAEALLEKFKDDESAEIRDCVERAERLLEDLDTETPE